jgi:hypothetical protein
MAGLKDRACCFFLDAIVEIKAVFQGNQILGSYHLN